MHHTRFFWMRRHARVDVLSIVTFNYWFGERDANKHILFIDNHKYSFYNDKTAISMPKFIVSDFNQSCQNRWRGDLCLSLNLLLYHQRIFFKPMAVLMKLHMEVRCILYFHFSSINHNTFSQIHQNKFSQELKSIIYHTLSDHFQIQ